MSSIRSPVSVIFDRIFDVDSFFDRVSARFNTSFGCSALGPPDGAPSVGFSSLGSEPDDVRRKTARCSWVLIGKCSSELERSREAGRPSTGLVHDPALMSGFEASG